MISWDALELKSLAQGLAIVRRAWCLGSLFFASDIVSIGGSESDFWVSQWGSSYWERREHDADAPEINHPSPRAVTLRAAEPELPALTAYQYPIMIGDRVTNQPDCIGTGRERMTPGRRTLSYRSFDEIMPDVERLLQGHTTVGKWSLAQICRHVAIVLRRVVDLPATTPHDPSMLVGEEQKRQFFDSGIVPEGMQGPPEVIPTDGLGEREEAEGLRQAIEHYKTSPGPVIPHRRFGPLTRAEWDRFQLIHTAHHLSFAVPKDLSRQ
jgi:Protein of unknown function (DUF1569)